MIRRTLMLVKLGFCCSVVVFAMEEHTETPPKMGFQEELRVFRDDNPWLLHLAALTDKKQECAEFLDLLSAQPEATADNSTPEKALAFIDQAAKGMTVIRIANPQLMGDYGGTPSIKTNRLYQAIMVLAAAAKDLFHRLEIVPAQEGSKFQLFYATDMYFIAFITIGDNEIYPMVLNRQDNLELKRLPHRYDNHSILSPIVLKDKLYLGPGLVIHHVGRGKVEVRYYNGANETTPFSISKMVLTLYYDFLTHERVCFHPLEGLESEEDAIENANAIVDLLMREIGAKRKEQLYEKAKKKKTRRKKTTLKKKAVG